MNINEALQALIDGKKIKLPHWVKDQYIFYKGPPGSGQIVLMQEGKEYPHYDFVGVCQTYKTWELNNPKFDDLKVGDRFCFPGVPEVECIKVKINSTITQYNNTPAFYNTKTNTVSYNVFNNLDVTKL